jgi:hypothetical protein
MAVPRGQVKAVHPRKVHQSPQSPLPNPNVKKAVPKFHKPSPWKRNQVVIKPPERRVVKVSPHRLAENRQSASRRHGQLLEQYRDAITKLKDIGRGKALIMVACGPSISEAPLEQLRGHNKIDIMCINKPDPRVWPSTYWGFCDQSQYARNKDIWNSYNGTVVNASSVRVRRPKQVLIRSLSAKGFSKDLVKGYYIGRSSTYANLQVAVWMGYDKIYIFGLDMGSVGGKLHYYGKNPDVSDENRLKRFSREAESYDHAAKTLNAVDRQRIVICSSYNKYKFVDSFSRLHQADAVNIILEAFGNKKG